MCAPPVVLSIARHAAGGPFTTLDFLYRQVSTLYFKLKLFLSSLNYAECIVVLAFLPSPSDTSVESNLIIKQGQHRHAPLKAFQFHHPIYLYEQV